MKKNWNAIADLVGTVAIVASLIFVGIQINQSREIAIAEQYQARATASQERLLWFADNDLERQRIITSYESRHEAGELGEVFEEEYRNSGPEYLAFKHYSDMATLVVWDNLFMQYQMGTMDEESWAAFRSRFKLILQEDLFRQKYLDIQMFFRKTFRELSAEIIAEIESEQAQVAQ